MVAAVSVLAVAGVVLAEAVEKALLEAPFLKPLS